MGRVLDVVVGMVSVLSVWPRPAGARPGGVAEGVGGACRRMGLGRSAYRAAWPPAVTAARETWYELTSVRERHRSLEQLAGERRRLLGATEEQPSSDRDPDRLAGQAARTREEEKSALEQVEEAVDTLAEAIQDREDSEAQAREAAALIQAGAIDGLSIGYRTISAERDGKGRRLLSEVELWEVSLVTFPMLREAKVGRKSEDLGEDDLAEALRAATEATIVD